MWLFFWFFWWWLKKRIKKHLQFDLVWEVATTAKIILATFLWHICVQKPARIWEAGWKSTARILFLLLRFWIQWYCNIFPTTTFDLKNDEKVKISSLVKLSEDRFLVFLYWNFWQFSIFENRVKSEPLSNKKKEYSIRFCQLDTILKNVVFNLCVLLSQFYSVCPYS